MATSLRAPLPDILPGALPQLATLELELAQLKAALPASWGAAPDTLPALQYLHVCLQHSAHGRLPPEWARGFPRLGELHLTDSSSVCCCRAELHPAVTLRLQSRHGPRPSPSAALLMPTFWLTDCHHTLSGVSPMCGILCCSWRVWGCVLTACQAPPSTPPGRAQARWAR